MDTSQVVSLGTASVMDLQEAMLKEEQVEIPTLEFVTSGLYTREIIIPKGTALVSRVWKDPYVDIMVSGDITVVADGVVKRFTGYNVFAGVPGRKRAGYTHEDTIWITVHRTEAKSHEGLMELLSVKNVDDLLKLESSE